MFSFLVSSVFTTISSFCIIGGLLLLFCSDQTYGQGVYGNEGKKHQPYQKSVETSAEKFSVPKRGRPEFSPLGLRYRSFIILPFLTSGLNFDNNIYSSKNIRSDFIVRNEAGINIRSDWSRHLLNLHLSADDYRYLEYYSENRTDVRMEIDNRLDFTSDWSFSNNATILRGHENREQAENLPGITAEPTAYTFIALSSALTHNNSFGKSRIKGSIKSYDYHDVSAVAGGYVEQDHRDSIEYQLAVHQSYNLNSGYEIFGELTGDMRNFRNIAGYADRDASGYRINTGLRFEVTEVMAGSIGIGKQVRNFSNADIEDVSAVTLYASLLWNPTRLMTINMSLKREISDTQYLNASGKILTKFSAEFNYEILRNVIGSLKADYLLEEYRGISRDDESWSAEINLEYLINNKYSLDGYVRYKGRNSNLDNLDFDKTVIGTNIKIKFGF